MSIIRRRRHEVPGLNTSSLPDLIFTVLFFFMIVTHMQSHTVKVRYQVPQGSRLTRLVKRSTIQYVYVGTPADGRRDRFQIQLNDKMVTPEQMTNYLQTDRQSLSPEDARLQTVSIKADRHTPMRIMMEVKMALRRAGTLKISYTATDKRN